MERIQSAANLDLFLCMMQFWSIPHEQTKHAIDLFGWYVIPHFKTRRGKSGPGKKVRAGKTSPGRENKSGPGKSPGREKQSRRVGPDSNPPAGFDS
jgi:hypothetical protein